MRVFGLELNFGSRKSAGPLAPVDNRGAWGGWMGFVREPWAGAWQRNIEIRRDTVLKNPTMFACITLISSDISKLAWKMQKFNSETKTWEDYISPVFSKVLDRPNRYQNHIQFTEQYLISKLSHGNTYVLKERDARNVVVALYILNPMLVTPLVDEDGNVYYQLAADNLSGISKDGLVVPASEIIHDRFNCLFHPLVGLSPIFACGLPAMLGMHMMENYTKFFRNGSMPSGILTAPGQISNETAARLKADWEANYTGQNSGRVAVLGDNLKFEKMAMTAVDSQLIDQLRFSDEKICSVYHVPQYKVGVGAQPTYNNIEALQQDYYSTCLQSLIESFELCMDQGLSLPDNISICLDLDGLLRMDSATRMTTVANGIKGSVLTPNEGRLQFGLPPVAGGDSVLSQQQNYSLEALAKRDAQSNPFASNSAPSSQPAAPAAPAASATTDQEADAEKSAAWKLKFLAAFDEAFDLETMQ